MRFSPSSNLCPIYWIIEYIVDDDDDNIYIYYDEVCVCNEKSSLLVFRAWPSDDDDGHDGMMTMMVFMVLMMMMMTYTGRVLSLWGVMEAQVSVGNNDNEHFDATSPTHTSTPVLPDEYQRWAKNDFFTPILGSGLKTCRILKSCLNGAWWLFGESPVCWFRA